MNKHLARILVALTAATITMAQPIASAAVQAAETQETETPKITRTYRFVVDGGENDYDPQTIESGGKLTEPEAPAAKEGQTFLGWYEGESETAVVFNQEIDFTTGGEVILTAKFEEKKSSEVQEAYQKLISADTLEALNGIMDSLSEDVMEAFTDTQEEELTKKLTALGYYDQSTAKNGWGGQNWPQGGDSQGTGSGSGSSSSGTDLDPGSYNADIPVYWDTVTGTGDSASSAGSSTVESVKLGVGDTLASVTYGNASKTSSSWSGGSTLSVYFPGATASASGMKTATMAITAKPGYYVTEVIVACAPNSGVSPFKCSTWKAGNAFDKNYTLTNSNYKDGKYTLEFECSSKYFSHTSSQKGAVAYFILIRVAKVPTPLYVEYDYGNVSDFLTVDSNSAFSSPTWTVKNDSNIYGSSDGGVYTNGTQFAYAYGEDTSVIANWKHCANKVSDKALAEAAAAGYRFAGWKATWYNTCTIKGEKDSHNNIYTMSFSSQYMTTEKNYQPGDDVQLPTNVQLVAQWEPIQLKVTKTVSGLGSIEEHKAHSNSFTLQLQKLNASTGNYEILKTQQYDIVGDGTLTYIFAAKGDNTIQQQVITPGTYKVVEIGNYDITGTTVNAYCTTTYPAETVEVTATGEVQELKVLNTYSSTPANYTVTIKKTLSGDMCDFTKKFAFKISADKAFKVDETDYAAGAEYTADLSNDGTVTISVPIGAVVKVLENPDGYDQKVTVTEPTSGVTTKAVQDGSDKGISFTMPSSDVSITFDNSKNATPDTGISLDSLPYLVILALVAAGVVIFIRKRRRSFDD